MELTHRFRVPTDVGETWAHFQDIAQVAECFPGAQVTEHDGDSFHGSVKVKLGPIALVYNGSGTFVEKDEAARRMVIDAKGKDKRGNGTAGAHVTATMTEAGTGTHVEVLTELAITGKPAQFGRGVMQDVSDKLLGQFTACLEQKVGDASAASAASAALAAEPTEPAASTPPSPGSANVNGSVPPDERMQNVRQMTPPGEESPRPQDDALDLGATVLPVLLKSYWRQALGVVVVLLVLRRLLRRG